MQTRFTYQRAEGPKGWDLLDTKTGLTQECDTRQEARELKKFAEEYVAKWGDIDFGNWPESLDTQLFIGDTNWVNPITDLVPGTDGEVTAQIAAIREAAEELFGDEAVKVDEERRIFGIPESEAVTVTPEGQTGDYVFDKNAVLSLENIRITFREVGVQLAEILKPSTSFISTEVGLSPEIVSQALQEAPLEDLERVLNDRKHKLYTGREPVDATSHSPRVMKQCPKCGHAQSIAESIASGAATNLQRKCSECGEYSNSLEFVSLGNNRDTHEAYACSYECKPEHAFRAEICMPEPNSAGHHEAFLVVSAGCEANAVRRGVKRSRNVLRKIPDGGSYMVWISERDEEGRWQRKVSHKVTRDTEVKPEPISEEENTEPLTTRQENKLWFIELAQEQEDKRDRTQAAFNTGYCHFHKDNRYPVEIGKRWGDYEDIFREGFEKAKSDMAFRTTPKYWFIQLAEEQSHRSRA